MTTFRKFSHRIAPVMKNVDHHMLRYYFSSHVVEVLVIVDRIHDTCEAVETRVVPRKVKVEVHLHVHVNTQTGIGPAA